MGPGALWRKFVWAPSRYGCAPIGAFAAAPSPPSESYKADHPRVRCGRNSCGRRAAMDGPPNGAFAIALSPPSEFYKTDRPLSGPGALWKEFLWGLLSTRYRSCGLIQNLSREARKRGKGARARLRCGKNSFGRRAAMDGPPQGPLLQRSVPHPNSIKPIARLWARVRFGEKSFGRRAAMDVPP